MSDDGGLAPVDPGDTDEFAPNHSIDLGVPAERDSAPLAPAARSSSLSSELTAAVAARLGHVGAVPLLCMAIASLVVMLAAARAHADGAAAALADYAFAVGLVQLALAVLLLVGHRVRPATLASTPVAHPRCGPISVLQLCAAFVLVWWTAGTFVLTFAGPFVHSGAGFFAAWTGVFASWRLLADASAASPFAQKLVSSGRSGAARGLLHLCAVVLVIASRPPAFRGDAAGILGVVVAVAQFVANLVVNVAQERCMGPPRRAASLLLLAGWLAAALVLTLFGPFVESGNGFFACWVGVAAAVAFAWEERRG